MNLETARFNMIEQQIRPWDVLDQDVLDLLSIVKREEFVPPALRSLAFVDTELPLPGGENMLTPKAEARFLQELEVKPHEVALEIGAGSGYMAALIAQQAKRVTTVEISPELCRLAESNLARQRVANVTVVEGNGAAGWPAAGRVDIICVSGALPQIPTTLLEQLQVHGRLCAIVGEAPVMRAQVVTRTGADTWETSTLFETCATLLRDINRSSHFRF